jgi:hypothetical protein
VTLPHRIIVWAGPTQLSLVRDAAAASLLQIVGAGSDSPESTGTLSRELGVPGFDDLRSAVRSSEAHAIWVVEPAPIQMDQIRVSRDRGMPIFASEPLAIAPSDSSQDRTTQTPIFVPRMVRSPGFRAAMEILPQLGPLACLNIAFRSGPAQGSLFARLFDATEVLLTLCEEVQSVNAALAGPLSAVPESLANLRGHLSINFRFKSNCCACAALSDSAGTWFRGVTLLAEGGCVRISDGGFVWHGPDGVEIDSHSTTLSCPPGDLIGQQIARVLDDIDAGAAPLDHTTMLALCEATRLSCLTGQNETPARLLEMMSRP